MCTLTDLTLQTPIDPLEDTYHSLLYHDPTRTYFGTNVDMLLQVSWTVDGRSNALTSIYFDLQKRRLALGEERFLGPPGRVGWELKDRMMKGWVIYRTPG